MIKRPLLARITGIPIAYQRHLTIVLMHGARLWPARRYALWMAIRSIQNPYVAL